MTSEEHIRELSLRVTAPPTGSKEYRSAMDELQAALKANADLGRLKLARLQAALPHPSSTNQR